MMFALSPKRTWTIWLRHVNLACPLPEVLELLLLVPTVKGGAELCPRIALVGGSTLGAWLRRRQRVPSGIGAYKEKSRRRPSKRQQKRAICCISRAWETVFAPVTPSSTVNMNYIDTETLISSFVLDAH